jgi:ArsR family transcriptional regulator
MGLAESFRALSDPQRRQVLMLLRGGRKTAGELAEALGVSASALSYHLSALKKADMVIEYRVKNYVYYELNTTLFDEMLMWMEQFREDGEK